MSIVVRPNLRSELWGLLPLAAGLGVARTLESHFLPSQSARVIRLKWPNDLLLDGRKLGGILCQGTLGEFGVIGLGLNINNDLATLAEPARSTSITLIQVTNKVSTIEPTAEMVRISIMAMVGRAERDPGVLIDEYRASCVTLRKKVRWDDGEGLALDINESGGLVVEPEGGSGPLILTQEVHLVPG